MLRILHIVVEMGRGGIQAMLMNYYRNIDRSRVQFDFLIHKVGKNNYHNEITRLGGRIFKISKLNPFSKKYRREVYNFFKEHSEYTIVHCHLDCMSAIPIKEAKKAGVPIRIAHAHSNGQDKDWKYLLKLYFKRKIKEQATHLWSCGVDAGVWTFGNHNFEIIPNAIEIEQYKFNEEKRIKRREDFHILQDDFVVGHVGRFSPVKNHDFLLDVFFQIHLLNPKAKLLLLGEGETKNKIQEKVESLKLTQHVIFAGVHKNVADYLQAMDVFVLPSLYEGLGIAAIEAQANGLPCIVSDNVPIESKVTKQMERVSLKEDVGVWAKKIISFANKRDVTSHQNLINEMYNIKNSAKVLQNRYYILLNEAKHG